MSCQPNADQGEEAIPDSLLPELSPPCPYSSAGREGRQARVPSRPLPDRTLEGGPARHR